jgi:hypothetical protein
MGDVGVGNKVLEINDNLVVLINVSLAQDKNKFRYPTILLINFLSIFQHSYTLNLLISEHLSEIYNCQNFDRSQKCNSLKILTI